jgi:sodium-dependent dicarboxylate transporter 2/3/5
VTSLVILGLELAWLAPALGQGQTLFLNAFFSDVTLLFLGGFVLSAAIEKTGLALWLASAILRRAGDSPRRVVAGMMIATSVLGVWMSNTAACALMLGPAAAMISRVPPGDGFGKTLLLGIAFSANLSGLATPVSSPPNAIVMRYLAAQGTAPSFFAWMAIALPMVIVLQAVLLVFLSKRYPTVVSVIRVETRPFVFDVPKRVVALVFATTVLGWIFGGALGLTAGTVALVPVVVFFSTRVLTVDDLRSLPWEVVLLIGGGLALGAAIEQSGLAAWFSMRLPIDGTPRFLVMGAVAVIAVVLSSFMSNTAAVNVLAPIVMGLASVPHATLLVVVAFACTLSMPLPISTPPNALTYGFRVSAERDPELTRMDMIGPGLFITVVGLVALAAFAAMWFPRFLPV